MENVTLSGDQFVLFSLLLELALAAGLATVLVSSNSFKTLLFAEAGGLRRDLYLSLLLGLFFAFGVGVRILIGYAAADLSLPGVFVIGLLTGPGPGAAAGAVVGLPALAGGEFLALPFYCLVGSVGGALRHALPRRDLIWSFSPLPFISIYRYVKSAVLARRIEGQLAVFLGCLGLDVLRYLLAGNYGGLLFSLHPQNPAVLVVMFLATLSSVGIPLKIWNNTRIEQQLEQRELHLLEARYRALKSQINPHFLFNTLNSISSCLFREPQKAKWIIIKLSEILRRLLQEDGDFVPLSKELEFIDNYLQIETIRFGEAKLKVKRRIDPRVLDAPVPGMILQPFVENALKHGIGPMISGGVLEIDATRRGSEVVVRIRDNGPGMNEGSTRRGIGIKNVRERLAMLYGEGPWCAIRGVEGGGTEVELIFPRSGSSSLEVSR